MLTDPRWDEERRKELVVALLENLRDPDEQVSQGAQGVLVSLNRDAVAALVGLVQGKDKKLRVKAATVLGQMGTMGNRHQEAVAPLTAALKDEDKEVRKAAAYALSQILVQPHP